MPLLACCTGADEHGTRYLMHRYDDTYIGRYEDTCVMLRYEDTCVTLD